MEGRAPGGGAKAGCGVSEVGRKVGRSETERLRGAGAFCVSIGERVYFFRSNCVWARVIPAYDTLVIQVPDSHGEDVLVFRLKM